MHCIEYNAYNTMYRVQSIEYNAIQKKHFIELKGIEIHLIPNISAP
jgi:hypothetical protein